MLESSLLDEGIFVTVVVPSFNVSHVAGLTANSLINQSYPQDKYEVIWVDDCSKDNTFEIVNIISNKFQNFFVKRNEFNKGRNYSRDYGVSLAKGELIIFLDSDNVVCHNFIKAHVDLHKGCRCVGIGNFAVRDIEYQNNFVRYWNSRSPEFLVNKGLIDPNNVCLKYFCTANCSVRKTDYVIVGGSHYSIQVSQGDDDYLAFKFSEIGLKFKFVKDAISDHKDKTFKIASYFFKLYDQGSAYKVLSTFDNINIINIAKYKYLVPISSNDKLLMMFQKCFISIIFVLKIPILFFNFAKHKEDSSKYVVPFIFYRIILAYAFFLGFRGEKFPSFKI